MMTYGARSVTWPQQQASSLKRSRGVSLDSAKAVGTFEGILIHDLHPGQSIVADVCVVSEDVDALAETAASHAGHGAKVAERRKRQKYRPACDQLGLGFMPLAIENDGALGKELQAFIRRCNEVALGINADCWHHLGSVFLRGILAPEDLRMPQERLGGSGTKAPAGQLLGKIERLPSRLK